MRENSRRAARFAMDVATPEKLNEDLVRAALRVVERRCIRRTSDGQLVGGAPHSEIALALRDLFPQVDDAEFDRVMAAIERAAVHISTTESAEPEDWEAYGEAAWDANIDPDDAFMPSAEPEDMWMLHHRAVIQHWDLELRKVIDLLVERDRPPSTPTRHGTGPR